MKSCLMIILLIILFINGMFNDYFIFKGMFNNYFIYKGIFKFFFHKKINTKQNKKLIYIYIYYIFFLYNPIFKKFYSFIQYRFL